VQVYEGQSVLTFSRRYRILQVVKWHEQTSFTLKSRGIPVQSKLPVLYEARTPADCDVQRKTTPLPSYIMHHLIPREYRHVSTDRKHHPLFSLKASIIDPVRMVPRLIARGSPRGIGSNSDRLLAIPVTVPSLFFGRCLGSGMTAVEICAHLTPFSLLTYHLVTAPNCFKSGNNSCCFGSFIQAVSNVKFLTSSFFPFDDTSAVNSPAGVPVPNITFPSS
jgi:hypothetical protein